MFRNLETNFRVCFKHIQAYLSTILEPIHRYSEPFLSLADSELLHIQKFNSNYISIRHIVVSLENSSRLFFFLQDVPF